MVIVCKCRCLSVCPYICLSVCLSQMLGVSDLSVSVAVCGLPSVGVSRCVWRSGNRATFLYLTASLPICGSLSLFHPIYFFKSLLFSTSCPNLHLFTIPHDSFSGIPSNRPCFLAYLLAPALKRRDASCLTQRVVVFPLLCAHTVRVVHWEPKRSTTSTVCRRVGMHGCFRRQFHFPAPQGCKILRLDIELRKGHHLWGDSS